MIETDDLLITQLFDNFSRIGGSDNGDVLRWVGVRDLLILEKAKLSLYYLVLTDLESENL